MHGDGITHRRVPWPILEAGELIVRWLVVVGRRFRCPECLSTRRVTHPGLRHGATYGSAMVAALLYVVASSPLGQGLDHNDAFRLVHDRDLPISERARSGRARWSSIRRWLRSPQRIWPAMAVPSGTTQRRTDAIIAGFGIGHPLHEVLDAAVAAHAHGGLAM